MSEIIQNPPFGWVENLRRGCKVWLVKSQEQAEIEFAYEAAEPGLRSGRLGIRVRGQVQLWWVGINGEGIDGSVLLRPLEGHLPKNPEPLPEPLIRQMQRQIERLEHRVTQLERIKLGFSYNNINWRILDPDGDPAFDTIE